jgi:hypothetical protein
MPTPSLEGGQGRLMTGLRDHGTQAVRKLGMIGAVLIRGRSVFVILEEGENRCQFRKSVSVCAVPRFWDSRGNQPPRPLVRSGRKRSERRWR